MKRIVKISLGVRVDGEDYCVENGKLVLSGTQVSDLTPLAGMPLSALDLYGTQVSDLTPLAGMPLKRLRLNGTQAASKPLPDGINQDVVSD